MDKRPLYLYRQRFLASASEIKVRWRHPDIPATEERFEAPGLRYSGVAMTQVGLLECRQWGRNRARNLAALGALAPVSDPNPAVLEGVRALYPGESGVIA